MSNIHIYGQDCLFLTFQSEGKFGVIFWGAHFVSVLFKLLFTSLHWPLCHRTILCWSFKAVIVWGCHLPNVCPMSHTTTVVLLYFLLHTNEAGFCGPGFFDPVSQWVIEWVSERTMFRASDSAVRGVCWHAQMWAVRTTADFYDKTADLYDKCNKRLWQLWQLLDGNHVTAWTLSVPFSILCIRTISQTSWFSKSQLANAAWPWHFLDKRINMHDAGDEGDDDTDDDDADAGDKCMQF